MKKAIRGGRVLIDWSQNNGAKTTIAPYSLRGRAHPKVAAPRTWEELDDPDLAQLLVRGGARARRDHRRSARGARLPRRRPRRGRRPAEHLHRQAHRRQDARAGAVATRPARRRRPASCPIFVIQEHHATALHWDFRLERDGVLVELGGAARRPALDKRNNLAIRPRTTRWSTRPSRARSRAASTAAARVTIWDDGRYELEKWRDDEVIFTARGAPGRAARPRAARADPHRRRGREVDVAAAPHEDGCRRAGRSRTACPSRRLRRRTGRRWPRASRRCVRPRRAATTLGSTEVPASATTRLRTPASRSRGPPAADALRPMLSTGSTPERAKLAARQWGDPVVGGGQVGRHPRGRRVGRRATAPRGPQRQRHHVQVPGADRGRRRPRRRTGDRRRRDRRARRARAARAFRCCRRA